MKRGNGVDIGSPIWRMVQDDSSPHQVGFNSIECLGLEGSVLKNVGIAPKCACSG